MKNGARQHLRASACMAIALIAVALCGPLRSVQKAMAATGDCFNPTYARWGNNGADSVVVDLWINNSVGNGVANVLGIDSVSLYNVVRRVEHRLNEQPNAGFQFRYRGTTTLDQKDGGVVIRAQNTSESCTGFPPGPEVHAAGAQTLYNTDGASSRHWANVTYFTHNKPSETAQCTHFLAWQLTDDYTAQPFEKVLMHELLHALGMKHVSNATTQNCYDDGQISVMAPLTIYEYPDQLMLWDEHRLQYGYNYRSEYSSLMQRPWSDQNGTWNNTWGLVDTQPLTPPGSGGQGYGLSLITTGQHSAGYKGKTHIFSPSTQMVTSTTTWDTDRSQGDVLATAVSPATAEVIVIRNRRPLGYALYAEGSHRNEIRIRRSLDGGATWATVLTLNGSSRQDASLAYDPKSNTFIVGVTGSPAIVPGTTATDATPDDSLWFYVIPAENNNSFGASTSTLTQTTAHSRFPPSIACKSGPWGCRVFWVDSTSGEILWTKMQVAPIPAVQGVQLDSITRETGTYGFESPSVTYYEGDDSFRVLFRQGISRVYARRLAPAGVAWTSLPDLVDEPSWTVGRPSSTTEKFCWGTCSYWWRAWITNSFLSVPQ